MLNLIFFSVAIILAFSKLPDLYSTLVRIRYIRQERNPIARFFMKKTGIKSGLYILTVIYMVIVVLTTFIAWSDVAPYSKIYFIVLGLIISAFNLGVAHHNYTGKDNFFTKVINKITGRFYY